MICNIFLFLLSFSEALQPMRNSQESLSCYLLKIPYMHTHIHYTHWALEVNNGNESDSLKKIEKQNNPKVINLL